MKHLIGLLLLSACNATPPEHAGAPTSAAPGTSPPALRTAWRESIQYRGAHLALVSNIQSLEADEARVDRLLSEHPARSHVPVVADAAADATAYAALLRQHADRLGVALTMLKVEVEPAPAPAPATVRPSEGVRYEQAQILGTHRLSLAFASRLDAERLVRGLGELDREPLLDVLVVEGDGATVQGRVQFLRDVSPAVILAEPRDPAAIVGGAGGEPNAVAAETAQKLRDNYAQVARLADSIKVAYGLEARLKLKTTRLGALTRFSEQHAKGTWEVLTGAAKAPHPH